MTKKMRHWSDGLERIGACTDGSEDLGPGFQETLERSAAPYVRIECSDGSSFALPADVAGTGPDPDDFRDYVPEGYGRPESVEIVPEGVLWRLTAPGYMDSTEWTPADDDDDARAAAEDTYGPFGDPDDCDDDDDDDDDEDEEDPERPAAEEREAYFARLAADPVPFNGPRGLGEEKPPMK